MNVTTHGRFDIRIAFRISYDLEASDMNKLTPSQDAYGQAMLDAFLGKDCSALIIERDDGYIDNDFAASGYLRSSPRSWSRLDRIAIKYANGRMLDIGCGAGRHALYLQQSGQSVMAIDVSPLAIRTSRLRGLKNTRVCSIADVSPKFGTFDTILMLGNNFGLFGSPSRAKRLLKRFDRMTTDDATIIAKCIDPYVTSLPQHLAYHRLNRSRGRMSGQLRIRVRYKDYASPWFDYLFVSATEMKDILRDTGWRIRKVLSDGDDPAFVAIIEKQEIRG
jgi:SAM-dependent methyltransferase